MPNTLKYFGLVIIFLVIGYLIRDNFLMFSLDLIKNGNTQIVYPNRLGGQFRLHILFSISIGIIPLLYLIIKKITKVNFINQGLISCGTIVVCGILLWQFRIFQLNSGLQKLAEFNTENGIKTELNFENLNFERYLFIGFLIGTILNILIFMNKKKTVTE